MEEKEKKIGKPKGLKDYTQEQKDDIMSYIFERIESGMSVFEASKDSTGKTVIAISTFNAWINDNLSYSKEYLRVRTVRHDRLAEGVMEDANNELITTKTIDTEKGTQVITYDNVERSRLKMNSKQWYLGMMDSERFGKKAGENSEGHVEQPLFDDIG